MFLLQDMSISFDEAIASSNILIWETVVSVGQIWPRAR